MCQLLLKNLVSFDITNCGNFCYKLGRLIYCKMETFLTKRGMYYKDKNFITKYDKLKYRTFITQQGIYYSFIYLYLFLEQTAKCAYIYINIEM